MELTYKIADLTDLDAVFALVKRAVHNMTANNIPQWDELYPTYDDLKTDIENRELYAGMSDGEIAVIFVLNRDYDPQYDDAEWKYTGSNFVILHRLCVDPGFQNKGVAKNALVFIENTFKGRGIESIRLDAFTQNPYALRLYKGFGFTTAGYADFRKGRFVLMEKSI